MTVPEPTGQIIPTEHGLDLVVTRTLPGSVRDAWASITEPERTARWMGRWEGHAAPDASVRLQLGFEDESPWCEVKILRCDPPRLLRVAVLSDDLAWELSFELTDAEEQTELRFVQHRITRDEVGGVAPGWEWYLDQLGASMTGASLPAFEDYFPAQSEYYLKQIR